MCSQPKRSGGGECSKIPKRLRFTWEDNVALVKEIVAEGPHEDPRKWDVVRDNVEIATGKQFQVKTLKQHLEQLLQKHRTKVQIDLKSSGKEVAYSDLDHLLEELNAKLKTSCTKVKKARTVKENTGKTIRENIAAEYIETMFVPNEGIEVPEIMNEHSYSMAPQTDDDSPEIVVEDIVQIEAPQTRQVLGPNRIRANRRAQSSLKVSSIAYLKEKEKKQNELKERELALEEKKTELEEKKIEIEKKRLELEERKINMDIEERVARLEMENARNSVEIKEREKHVAVISVLNRSIEILEEKLELALARNSTE